MEVGKLSGLQGDLRNMLADVQRQALSSPAQQAKADILVPESQPQTSMSSLTAGYGCHSRSPINGSRLPALMMSAIELVKKLILASAPRAGVFRSCPQKSTAPPEPPRRRRLTHPVSRTK